MKMREELYDFLAPIVGEDIAKQYLTSNHIDDAYFVYRRNGNAYAVIFALGGSGK